ncbi:hypothetical protein C8Q75DRAFT_751437 [Abortiporus biennis]|nr:hypothetical protein C8Q75DRAFT_751437 [Abortiporus biennis]
MVPDLPPEIVGLIISYSDYETQLSSAFVCREWCSLSRSHIFREVSISSKEDHAREFLGLIRQRPSISIAIRTLNFSNRSSENSYHEAYESSSLDDVADEDALLPNLRTMRIFSFDVYDFILTHIPAFHAIVHLELVTHRASFRKFTSMINHLPSLEFLVLNRVHFMNDLSLDQLDIMSSNPRYPRIKAIRLIPFTLSNTRHSFYMPSFHQWLLKGSETRSLTSVSLRTVFTPCLRAIFQQLGSKLLHLNLRVNYRNEGIQIGNDYIDLSYNPSLETLMLPITLGSAESAVPIDRLYSNRHKSLRTIRLTLYPVNFHHDPQAKQIVYDRIAIHLARLASNGVTVIMMRKGKHPLFPDEIREFETTFAAVKNTGNLVIENCENEVW